MGAPERPGKGDSSATSGRRSTRLAIAIPVSISGRDSRDQTFKENTRTVIINKHGAKIVTFHELALGSEILLENRALGRSAKTFVVWLGDRRSVKEAQEVGVQLSEPQNIWGIDFAPDDWQEGPPIGEGGQRLEKAAAPSPPSPAPATASTAGESASAAITAPGTVTDAALQGRFQEFEQKLNEHIEQLFTKNQARMEIAANRHEQMIEQGLDERFGGLEKRLEAERKNLEQLLAKLQDLQKTTQDSVETTRRNIQAATFETLETATEELNQKVRGQLESASAKFAEEARKRVEQSAAAAVDSFGKEAKARLSQLTQEYLASLQPQFEAQQKTASEQIQKLSLAALQELQKKSDGVLGGFEERLQKSLREVQEKGSQQVTQQLQKTVVDYLGSASKDLKKQAADSLTTLTAELKATGQGLVTDARKQVEEIRAKALESLMQEGKAIARDYPGQVRKMLQDFQDQRTRELEDHLQKALEKQRQAILKQVQLVGEDEATKAAAQVKTKCEEVAHLMLGELDQRESTLKDWEEGASGRLEAYSQLLEGSARASAETFQEQAAEVFNSTMERLKKDAGGLEEKMTREIVAKIQEASRQQVELANKEFEKRTEDSLELVAEQLKEKQEEIIGEASEVFRTTLGQMLLGGKKESESAAGKKRR
jgi:hypothetical protein